MNLSKLVDEDEPLFLSLIEDMFPGIKLTSQTYKDLQKAIANATLALGIINHQEWNLKTVQVRWALIIQMNLKKNEPFATLTINAAEFTLAS